MFKFTLLALIVALRSRRKLALENVALRHLAIVQPDTVIRWHRAGVRPASTGNR